MTTVDRVFDGCAGLDTGQVQRADIGDVVDALLPESVVSATPGAAADVSSVKLNEAGLEVLPAMSVCRTCTS
ncbi:hypothetical protein, partial [Burkholderia stagnalis]|uniref:hypothetical protein n=1 Tax=Burkholderia stagnalis TaxID=1503054 RepID=UPI001E6480AB